MIVTAVTIEGADLMALHLQSAHVATIRDEYALVGEWWGRPGPRETELTVWVTADQAHEIGDHFHGLARQLRECGAEPEPEPEPEPGFEPEPEVLRGAQPLSLEGT